MVVDDSYGKNGGMATTQLLTKPKNLRFHIPKHVKCGVFGGYDITFARVPTIT
jgi:hypothetical protein